MRRLLLLLLPLLGALALAAAGCGGGVPSSFANCKESTARGADDPVAVLPRTFDCLARAYRSNCSPAEAQIANFGVDTGDSYDVRVYRRRSRCAGDVRVVRFFMGSKSKPVTYSCRQAFLLGTTLTMFGCGKEEDVALERGRDCNLIWERIRQRDCRRAGVKCPPAPAVRPDYSC